MTTPWDRVRHRWHGRRRGGPVDWLLLLCVLFILGYAVRWGLSRYCGGF